jgi:hypothetical protein
MESRALGWLHQSFRHKKRAAAPWRHEYPDLLQFVLDQMPIDLKIRHIKPRYSGTMQQSNNRDGCCRCDRIFGEHFMYRAWHNQEEVYSFPINISQQWHDVLINSDDNSYKER